jgi:predicted DNA-binding protein YlxM (UPF0122 family)
MKTKILISVKDYANEKGVTPQAVYQQIKRGTVKAVRIGKHTLILN